MALPTRVRWEVFPRMHIGSVISLEAYGSGAITSLGSEPPAVINESPVFSQKNRKKRLANTEQGISNIEGKSGMSVSLVCAGKGMYRRSRLIANMEERK